MLFCATTNTVIGNVGWVDKGRLWCFDVHTHVEDWIEIEGASHLSISAGRNNLFRLVHHQNSNSKVSIRSLAEPKRELASVHFSEAAPIFAGDTTLWECVEPAFITYINDGPTLNYIDGTRREVLCLDLSWYNDANYDLGYQGLTDVMTLKDFGLVVVSVQRSSKLILIDLSRNKASDHISLAGRGGNPNLRRCSAKLFLASDYDTMCLVDLDTRKLRRSTRLQESEPQNTMQFIGDYDLGGTGSILVARPFSGDVLKLDPNLRIIDQVSVGEQPLAICSTTDGGFVTRDWKTGRVMTGAFAGA